MKTDAFIKSLNKKNPPQGLSDYLMALWYDAKGNWHQAHKVVQEIDDETGSLLHAYLHRKEGDLSNASYWYGRAGKERPKTDIKSEWQELVNNLTSS